MRRTDVIAAFLVTASLAAAQAQDKPADKKAEPPKDGIELPLKPSKRIEFSTNEGTWMSLDLSPDGNTIVFELLGDLYTVPVGGGEAKLLMSGTQYDGMPRFSPDGKKIAFISDRSGAENLWICDADGKNPKALTQGRDSLMLSPTWSPDGNYVIVSKQGGGLGTFTLHMVDIRGGSGVPIVKSTGPGINRMGAISSPDGRFLYYGQRQGSWTYDGQFPQWQVYRFDRKTGESTVVTNVNGSALRPMLSPDGNTLYFASRYRTQTGLRARNLKTGEERWVAFPIDRDDQESRATRDTVAGYALTRDGKSIITPLNGKIQRIDVETGRATVIPFEAKVALDVNPSVHFQHRVDDDAPVRAKIIRCAHPSPDGKSLVFQAFDRVWTLDLSDPAAQPKRLTKSDAGEFQPTWSPDGKQVVYVTWGAEGGHIWSVPAEGGVPRRLTMNAAFYSNPVVSPDGTKIAYLIGDRIDGLNLYQMLPDHGCFELSEDGIPRAHDAEIAPSGPNKPFDVFTIPIWGGPSSFVASAQDAGSLQFSQENDRLYMVGGSGLSSIRLDGLDRRQLVKFTGQILGTQPSGANDIRISPDGNQALIEIDGQLYTATLPQTGEPLSIPVGGGGSVPVKKVASLGGDYLGWSRDGKGIFWSQGAKFYRQSLEDEKPKVSEINLSVPQARPDGTIVLKGARIITMRGDEVIPSGDIVINRNRIAMIGKSGTLPLPADAKVIDVAGKTIAPGWVDVHSHWFAFPQDLHLPQSWAYMANLAYGVTTNRDPQSAVTDIYDYAAGIAAGNMVGPRIFTTGPGFFKGSSLDDKESIKNYLNRYKDAYDTYTLKQYVRGDRMVRQYTIEACKELGITPTCEGALDTKLGMTEMIDGYSGHEHAFPIFPMYNDMAQLISKTQTYYTPTLLVTYGAPFGENYWFTNSDAANDPKLYRFVPPSMLDQMLRRRSHWNLPEEYGFQGVAEACAKVVKAGGKVCLGSHGEMQGLGAHWELWSLASGGMSPLEALRCATLNGAEAIGLSQDLGSLEPGKLADLVIYDRNPLENIRNTASMRMVMKNGELYNSDTLDRVWPKPMKMPRMYWQGNEPRPTIGK